MGGFYQRPLDVSHYQKYIPPEKKYRPLFEVKISMMRVVFFDLFIDFHQKPDSFLKLRLFGMTSLQSHCRASLVLDMSYMFMFGTLGAPTPILAGQFFNASIFGFIQLYHVYPTNEGRFHPSLHLPPASQHRFCACAFRRPTVTESFVGRRYLRSFEWAVSRLPPSHLPENMKLRSGGSIGF